MFVLNKDLVNQHGINIKDHILVIRNVNCTISSNIYISDPEQEPFKNINYSLHYSVVSYISQEVKDSGLEPLPLTIDIGMGPTSTFYVNSVSIEVDNLIPFCEKHFIGLITGEEKL